MPKIKNAGTATMKFNEGIIASGSVTATSDTSAVHGAIHSSGSIVLSSEADVNIDIEVQATRPRIRLMSNAGSNNAAIMLERSYDGGSGMAAVRSGDTLSQIETNGFDGSNFINAASIKVVADGTPSSNDMPGRIEFRTTPDGASAVVTRMTVKNDGKVGIGLSDPSYKLHVQDDVSDYVAIIDNDQGSSGHGLKVTSDGTGAGTFLFDVESASTTLFRVRGDGRVGIGKVSSLPAAVLTVSSSNSDADLAIAHKIQHIGDSDTYIQFADDEIQIAAGGRTFIKIEEASTDKIMINHGALDIDFQVKGENDANLLRTDAGNDSIYFGASESAGTDNNFFVSGSMGSKGSSARGTAVFGGDLVVSGALHMGAAYRFPISDGTNNQVIKTDGNGNLSFTNQSGGGGSGDNLSLTALKTSNYTASNWEMVLVNLVGASTDVTVTLPAASSDKQVAVKIAGAAMGKRVIVDGNASETIDGETTKILDSDYESIHMISDGSNWWRIS